MQNASWDKTSPLRYVVSFKVNTHLDPALGEE